MRDWPDPRLPGRLVGIAAGVAVMVAVVVFLGPSVARHDEDDTLGPSRTLTPPGAPIAAEADVYRMKPVDLATDPGASRRAGAHARSVTIYRRLRAYPGAPPRIPHALTEDEFRNGKCNTCHERGGFVGRFAAYAPITPHPEMPACLQCHVADDRLVGLPFPSPSEPVCTQCHILGQDPPIFVALDWRQHEWPATGQTAIPGGPPLIPHDFHLRGNCVACHTGTAAVVRTTHPERANCRQCHVPAPTVVDVEDFVRPGPTEAGSRPAGDGS